MFPQGEENPEKGGEGRHLRPHRHERRHRRRGALVDIRRPHVEGHGRHLEAQAHDDKAQPDEKYRPPRGRMGGEPPGDIHQIQRTGRPVDECHPVEQKTRGKRAEKEILHRGLVSPEVAPHESGQDIERERKHLQPHENHQEIPRRRHQHHPRGREKDEAEVLARRRIAEGGLCRGDQDRHETRKQQ